MYRVHRILLAIVFALCVMLGTAASAVPEFFVCESGCSCQRTLNAPEEYEGSLTEVVTRTLCFKTDVPLCGWQLDLRGFDADLSDDTSGTMHIKSFKDEWSSSGKLVGAPPLTSAGPSLSVNWVNEGSRLAAETHTLGEIKLSPGEVDSRLSARATSLAVEEKSATATAECSAFEQIAVDSGPLFLIPEPPRALLLAAGLALLAGLAAARRYSGLVVLLLAIAGGSPAARAEVVAASRALRNADLDLVAPSSLGTALAGMGDLNGDGIEDLAVGLPDADGGVGRVQIALLRSDGSVDAVVPVGEGLAGFVGPLMPGSAFGTAVASAGDLNGDGIDELAVAAPGSHGLWLLFLQRGGPLGPPVFVSNAVEIDTTHEVHALAGLGDVDGDGVPDLALGHPFYGGSSCSECGAVSILRLDSMDWAAEDFTILPASSSGWTSLVPLDHFGAGLAGVGDLDGNGVPDLAVGTPGRDSGQGNVSILFLATSGTTVSSSVLLYDLLPPDLTVSLGSGDAFGSAIAALGDLDANGSQDLAVGVPGLGGSDEGAVVALTLTSAGALIDASLVTEPALSAPFTSDGDFGRALASLDVDGDGDREVVAGSAGDAVTIVDQGIAWFLHFADPDGDGRPDAFADNCAGTRNPSQADTDADGVGDACDNCVDFENGPRAGICREGDVDRLATTSCTAHTDCDGSTDYGFCSMDQEDADEDGVGDVCEGVVVRLKGPFAAEPAPGVTDVHWKLSIDCGRHRVEKLAVSLFQSDLSASLPLDFSGCDVPTGFPFGAGMGCGAPLSAAGPTVSDASGVFISEAAGVFLGLSGLRPNTLYAFLYGAPWLCLPFEEDVPLAWAADVSPTSVINDLSIAASQLELAELVPGTWPPEPVGGNSLVTESGPLPGFCVADEDTAGDGGSPARLSAVSSTPSVDIEVDVSVAADQVVEGYQAWEVCFASDEYLRRIRLAIAPSKVRNDTTGAFRYTRGDLEWMGWDSGLEVPDWHYTFGNDFVLDGNTFLFRYPVDNEESSVDFPVDPGDDSDNRLYPVLTGVRPGFSSTFGRLNHDTTGGVTSRVHCIGQVLVSGGSAKVAHAPIVFIQGETYLDALADDFCVDNPDEPDCVTGTTFDAFNNADRYYGCRETSADKDEDGVRFDADNCPYVSNPLQQDSGEVKLKAPPGDGVGDACQCGEGDGDGIISSDDSLGFGLDLKNLREYLVGGSPEGFDARRCGILDASGPKPSCNVLDAVELQRALAATAGNTLSSRCDAYVLAE